jgi:hypothetical protein
LQEHPEWEAAFASLCALDEKLQGVPFLQSGKLKLVLNPSNLARLVKPAKLAKAGALATQGAQKAAMFALKQLGKKRYQAFMKNPGNPIPISEVDHQVMRGFLKSVEYLKMVQTLGDKGPLLEAARSEVLANFTFLSRQIEGLALSPGGTIMHLEWKALAAQWLSGVQDSPALLADFRKLLPGLELPSKALLEVEKTLESVGSILQKETILPGGKRYAVRLAHFLSEVGQGEVEVATQSAAFLLAAGEDWMQKFPEGTRSRKMVGGLVSGLQGANDLSVKGVNLFFTGLHGLSQAVDRTCTRENMDLAFEKLKGLVPWKKKGPP